jgi:hypothetical protein
MPERAFQVEGVLSLVLCVANCLLSQSIEHCTTSKMLWSLIATLAALTATVKGQDYSSSPPHYPAPWARGGNGWADAYEKAQAFVSKLTLLEKVNLTTGVGWEGGPCVGNTGTIPRLNFPGICLQDSPLGVRDSKSAAVNVSIRNTHLK